MTSNLTQRLTMQVLLNNYERQRGRSPHVARMLAEAGFVEPMKVCTASDPEKVRAVPGPDPAEVRRMGQELGLRQQWDVKMARHARAYREGTKSLVDLYLRGTFPENDRE